MNRSRLWLPIAFLALLARPGDVWSGDSGDLVTDGESVEDTTQAMLTFLTFSVVPDSTADSLQVRDATGDDPSIRLVQLGGGFTVSETVPVYLEGYVGYARYDPTFIVDGVQNSDEVDAKWRTFSGTGGIGYDFPIAEDWVIRPVVNFSLAYMTSSAALEESLLGPNLSESGVDSGRWLDDGWLTTGGLGGALILDFDRDWEAYEADLEVRYRHHYLTSLASSRSAVNGSVHTDTLGLWGRLRVPTGVSLLDRPLRSVWEASHSWFAKNQTEVLGFDHLTKVGAGLELDLSAGNIIVERARFVVRYVFGKDISGVSLGFAVGF